MWITWADLTKTCVQGLTYGGECGHERSLARDSDPALGGQETTRKWRRPWLPFYRPRPPWMQPSLNSVEGQRPREGGLKIIWPRWLKMMMLKPTLTSLRERLSERDGQGLNRQIWYSLSWPGRHRRPAGISPSMRQPIMRWSRERFSPNMGLAYLLRHSEFIAGDTRWPFQHVLR